MKHQLWQFCLALLISPLIVLGQYDAVVTVDTFTSPASPLFISFQTQVHDNKKINIQWQVRADSTEYFTIERSVEGKIYEAIGILKAAEGLYKYSFADEFPTRGQVYYRIRCTAKSGNETYSDAVTVIMPGSTSFRFYPNPADKLLIVRSECAIDLLITDGFGKQRIAKSLANGPQVVDVSFLEKGVYILRITDKSTGRQQFDKFLKN
ncbi:MAG TPA: T9SS type A sorting domain-containing protein [Chitinophagaceae bacterium]|nr:T9SS type A sorting domain-containing protein [Chitinophagaceae bacterium]